MDERRFELAWRWFALHANQRMSAFHFFLLLSGILANAYVLLVREKLDIRAACLAFLATVVSFAFVMADRRNRQLLHLGEDLLLQIEKELFGTQQQVNSPGRGSGLLLRESREGQPPFYFKHWFLIEGVEVIGALSFLGAGIWVPSR